MKTHSFVALIAVTVIGLAGSAIAAETGKRLAKGKPAPTEQGNRAEHSNKGGATNGLTRAERAAGPHGDAGRHKAEARQVKRK